MLEWLVDNNIKVGLVTSKDICRTNSLINYFNLPLEVVITPESTSRGKPYPDPLYYACKEFSVGIEKAVFVGDMETDMQAARAANMDYLHFYPGYSYSGTEINYGFPIYSLLNIIDFMRYQ